MRTAGARVLEARLKDVNRQSSIVNRQSSIVNRQTSLNKENSYNAVQQEQIQKELNQ